MQATEVSTNQDSKAVVVRQSKCCNCSVKTWSKKKKIIVGTVTFLLVGLLIGLLTYFFGGNAVIEMSLVSSSASALSTRFGTNDVVGSADNNASELTSWKYYILSIQICESLTTSGTAWNNAKNCFMIYDNDVKSNSAYEQFGIDSAKQDTANYVDLLSSADIAKLRKDSKLTFSKAGAYNYGIVSWMKPVKVTATVPVSDGSFLYTRKTSTVSSNGYVTLADTPLTTSPAEESVVLLNNGGSWFKFQKPFVIRSSDISSNVPWKLSLAFNPDGLIQGSTQVSNYALGDNLGNGISVPMLDLAAVPHRANDKVMRETYHISFADASFSDSVLRLELYYLDSDPLKTIYAVTTAGIYVSFSGTSTKTVPMVQKVSFIEESNGQLVFLNYQRAPMISGFVRTTTVNQAQSCGFSPGNAAFGLSQSTTMVQTTYQLKSVSKVV